MQRVCAFFFNCATLKRINGRLGIDGRLSSWSRNQGDLLGLFAFYISHLIGSFFASLSFFSVMLAPNHTHLASSIER